MRYDEVERGLGGGTTREEHAEIVRLRRQSWVADITVPTAEGWLFLAAVIELDSRTIVGCSMRDDLEAPLVVDTISIAIARGRAHRSDPVQTLDQRAAAGLAAGKRPQLAVERRQLEIEHIEHAQAERDQLPPRRRQLRPP